MLRKPISRRAALAGMGAVGVSFSIPDTLKAASHAKKVNFYNWDTYIGETTLEDFSKATGIEVQYDLFADNDELFAKLKNGNPGYDLIVPTNDYVERMIVADMLTPLDHSKIPNMANIETTFLNPAFDPVANSLSPTCGGQSALGIASLRYLKRLTAGRISILRMNMQAASRCSGQVIQYFRWR